MIRYIIFLSCVQFFLVSFSIGQSDSALAFDRAYKDFLYALEENPTSERLGESALKALSFGELYLEEDSEDLAVLTFNVVRVTAGHDWSGEVLGGKYLDLSRLALSRYQKVYGIESEKLIEPYANLIIAISKEARKSDRLKEISDKKGRAEIRGLMKEVEINVLRQPINPIKKAGFYKRLAVSNLRDRQQYAKKALDIYQRELGEAARETVNSKLTWLSTLPMKKRISGYKEILPKLESFPEARRQLYLVNQVLSAFYLQMKKRDQAEYHLEQAGKHGEGLFDQVSYFPIFKSAPAYPRNAQLRGITGYVVLEFTVTERGTVENLSVIEALPKGVFEKAALDSASGFRYIPMYVNGVPTKVDGVRNRIDFDLLN